MLGDVILSPSNDPISFVWEHAIDLECLKSAEKQIATATQMVLLSTTDSTSEIYRNAAKAAMSILNDWHFVFAMHRFMFLVHNSSNDAENDWDWLNNKWLTELLSLSQAELLRRDIDWDTFVHMLQLPIQPLYHDMPEWLSNHFLQGLYPNAYSSFNDLKNSSFIPIHTTLTNNDLHLLRINASMEQSFHTAWKLVLVTKEGVLSDLDVF